jgi:hypothetical protein
MSRRFTSQVGFVGLILLVLAAVVTFYYSVRFSVLRPWAYEPARFTFAAIVFGRLIYVIAKAWYQSYGRSRAVNPARVVYAVPRRFGLGTLFLITFVFGILSAALNGLHLPPALVILVLAFVCVVGVLQAMLDRAPRHASMVAGSLFFPIAIGVWLYLWDSTSFAGMPLSASAFYAACWSIGGAAIGYITGTMVAGIFLLTDRMAAIFQRRVDGQEPNSSNEPQRLTPVSAAERCEPGYPYAPLSATHSSSSRRAEPL